MKKSKLRFRRAVPSPRPESKAVKHEYEWAFSVYDQLARKYPDQWVAFSHRKVLAAGKNPARVIQQAEHRSTLPEIPLLFVEGRAHCYLAHPD